MIEIDLIADVARSLAIRRETCIEIASTAKHRYKVYRIPKRSGEGLRTVAQPAREVKLVQKAIVEILKPNFPIHWSATAYKERVGLLQNATPHRECRFLTKLDFQSFFPSIRTPDITKHLERYRENANLSNKDISFITAACTWQPRHEPTSELCIGAPSSPWLSNTIMYEFDTLVFEWCHAKEIVYTRYSDDITISSKSDNSLNDAEKHISNVLSEIPYPRITLNQRKRVAVGRSAAMRVTGLTLANNHQITVGRKRKRGVRAGVHKYVLGNLNDDEFHRLKGELAFVLSIEPKFAKALKNTYEQYDLSNLLPQTFVSKDAKR